MVTPPLLYSIHTVVSERKRLRLKFDKILDIPFAREEKLNVETAGPSLCVDIEMGFLLEPSSCDSPSLLISSML